MDINKYRNCINKLIAWEWMILKQLRKSKRKNYFTKRIFCNFQLTIYFIFCFAIPFIISRLIIAIGLPNSLVDITRIICSFILLRFISPIDKISKNGSDEKNKRKLEVVKAVEKIIESYENKFK